MIMTLTLPCRVWAQKEQELAELRELAEENTKLAELRRQEAEKTKAAVETEKASYEKLVLMHQLEVAKMDQLHQETCNLTLHLKNLKLREEKVAAREKEIKEFRRHGKGARSAA